MENNVRMTEYKRTSIYDKNAPFKLITEKYFHLDSKEDFLEMITRYSAPCKSVGCEIKHTKDKTYFVFRVMHNDILVSQVDYKFLD